MAKSKLAESIFGALFIVTGMVTLESWLDRTQKIKFTTNLVSSIAMIAIGWYLFTKSQSKKQRTYGWMVLGTQVLFVLWLFAKNYYQNNIIRWMWLPLTLSWFGAWIFYWHHLTVDTKYSESSRKFAVTLGIVFVALARVGLNFIRIPHRDWHAISMGWLPRLSPAVIAKISGPDSSFNIFSVLMGMGWALLATSNAMV